MPNYTLIKNNNDILDFDSISNFEYDEKKSRFICYIFNINSKKQATEKLDEVRKANFNAKHIVYLYSLYENSKENIKFSDDGEPTGTGTKAIYEMIKKENLTNILVIVVRYFGGILLGAGPLSRAYLLAFKSAYLLTNKKEIIEYTNYNIKVKYNCIKDFEHEIEKYIKNENVIIGDKIYNENIDVDLKISKNILSEIEPIINKYII